jgi:hypothetical protein
MSAPRRLSLFSALVLAATTWSGWVGAAPCGRPDVDVTFPPDRASSVPVNAILTGHYSNPALYDDEPVTLIDASGDAVPLTTSFDEAEAVVRAVPDAPLKDGSYEASWPTLRGLTGGVGLGKKIQFFVQGKTDAAPPSFSGLSGIDWDLSRDKDPCTDRLEDRFVFKLELGAASDDAGVDLLALSVFETTDPLAEAGSAPSRVAYRAWPEKGELELRRPASKAGQTCFAAIAQDMVGSVSGGGEREVCVKTKKPPFFDGCSAVPRTSHAPSAPWSLGLALALLGVRLRRRGRDHGRSAPRSR